MISFYFLIDTMGLSRWQSGKEFACQCRRYRFNPWVRKIPWSRKWQPTPVFVPGKFHGHRCLTSCSPWDCEELNTTSDWTQHLILPLEMPGGPPVSETSCLWAVWISFLQVLQFSSVAQSCDPMDCSTPGFPVHHPTPRACSNSSIESVMPSNHLLLCPLLLLLPSILPSIRVFSSELFFCIRWPKLLEF